MADSVVVIIPARYGSTRFPGKVLVEIAGVPMIVRVYESACAIPGVDGVFVATDDSRIAAVVEKAGGRVVMTRTDHHSGTDRIAEAVEGIEASIVVNVQGDLPFLDPQIVVPLLELLRENPELPMTTVMMPIRDTAQFENPSVVKVVTDCSGNALYFSRRPIPSGAVLHGSRGRPGDGVAGDGFVAMHHIGIYAFRREFLSTFARLPATPLERAEGLEQLRALEHGYRIGVASWSGAPVIEVNTPADLE